MPSRARWTAIIVLFGVTLAGCGGAEALLHLATTVELYFDSGAFEWDLFEAAHVVGKVLGSGMA